jgi:Zn-dependent membrane protease YugP
LTWFGLLLDGVVGIFILFTLPIELNASLRGRRLLHDTGMLVTARDRNAIYTILVAIALTPLAVFMAGLLQFHYYLFLVWKWADRRHDG